MSDDTRQPTTPALPTDEMREQARQIVAKHYGYDVVENVSLRCAEVEFALKGMVAALAMQAKAPATSLGGAEGQREVDMRTLVQAAIKLTPIDSDLADEVVRVKVRYQNLAQPTVAVEGLVERVEGVVNRLNLMISCGCCDDEWPELRHDTVKLIDCLAALSQPSEDAVGCDTCDDTGEVIDFVRFSGEAVAGEPVSRPCPDCSD